MRDFEEQSDFLTKRSLITNLFYLKHLIEKQNNIAVNYTWLIGLRKAYGNVTFQMLWKVMKEQNVPKRYIQ